MIGRPLGSKNSKITPQMRRQQILRDTDELLQQHGPRRAADFLYRETLIRENIVSNETKAYLSFLQSMMKRKQIPLPDCNL